MNATVRAPSPALIRVLMVDDEPGDHRLVADLLDSLPDRRFSIEGARSLADGLDRLEKARFDVCLLDLRLPDGDGLDLLASAEMRGLGLPVVVLTGFPSVEVDRRAMALGAAGFLEKDKLDPTALERTIRYAIQQRKIAERIARHAFLDQTTGLIGTALYRERLTRALAFARRRDRQVAVMLIDLAVDPDAAVHQGDNEAALVEAGHRLTAELRETDSIARLSDARLGLLIEGMGSLHHAATVAGKALRQLRSPIEVGSRTIALQPSVGIAVYPREGGDGDGLMRRAEAAMHRAIAEGGGCRFASERVDHEAREGMILEKAFGIAFDRRELRLRYHPEMHLTRRRIGLAAEVRWRHPDRGWLAVDDNLAATDDQTLIRGMTDWMLAAAAEQMLTWRPEGLDILRLSLAVPFRRRPTLALLERSVRQRVLGKDLAPDRITLELQEALVLDDTRAGSADLASLKATGVRLALDGFGQGRAAIQEIRYEFLHGLSLTPDLYGDLAEDGRSERLLCALIELGHNLGLDITAKGAGDRRQFARLKRLGCDVVRLSDSSPPMSADTATTWLRMMARNPIFDATARRSSSPEILAPRIGGHRPIETETPSPPSTDR